MTVNESGTAPGSRESFGARLWRRPRRWWLLGIPAGGLLALVIGVAASAGVVGGLHQVETLGFCAQSCHEMSTAFQEYSQTIHYKNEVGVRAVCADCHVPRSFFSRVMTHAQASTELIGKITGKISTPAKYERERAEMAQSVWKVMKANDSVACRACHNFTAMDLAKQSPMAARRHTAAAQPGSAQTCIDCHKGIAHKLPDDAS
jgi:nitrate/TMAO reductase-like tetraheme cytochrome c subunit